MEPHSAGPSYPTEDKADRLNPLLRLAVNAPDAALVEKLVSRGKDPNSINNPELARSLLAQGANPNVPYGADGSAGLYVLTKNPSEEMIRVFSEWNKQTGGYLSLFPESLSAAEKAEAIYAIQENILKSPRSLGALIKDAVKQHERERIVPEALLERAPYSFQTAEDVTAFLNIRFSTPKEVTEALGVIPSFEDNPRMRYLQKTNDQRAAQLERYNFPVLKTLDALAGDVPGTTADACLINVARKKGPTQAAIFALIHSVRPQEETDFFINAEEKRNINERIRQQIIAVLASQIEQKMQRDRKGFLDQFTKLQKSEHALITRIKDKRSPETAARYALTHGIWHQDREVRNEENHIILNISETQYRENPQPFIDRLRPSSAPNRRNNENAKQDLKKQKRASPSR